MTHFAALFTSQFSILRKICTLASLSVAMLLVAGCVEKEEIIVTPDQAEMIAVFTYWEKSGRRASSERIREISIKSATFINTVRDFGAKGKLDLEDTVSFADRLLRIKSDSKLPPDEVVIAFVSAGVDVSPTRENPLINKAIQEYAAKTDAEIIKRDEELIDGLNRLMRPK
jgi:hypothetical protein